MRTPSPRIRIRETGNTDWQTRAACSVEDPDLFFPLSYDGPGQFQVAAARAVCNRCPIRLTCRDDALNREGSKAPEARTGIWGGLTPDERADLAGVTTGRKNRRAAA